MKILLPLDGSPTSRRAVDYVATRTALIDHNLEIHLLHVTHTVSPRSFLAPEEADRFYREQAEEFFASAREQFARIGVTPHEMVVTGDPATAIAETAAKFSPDLIVMGSRGMSPVRALLLGSVAVGVIAQTRRPVLLIRGETLPPDNDVRIGLAVDGSEFSKIAAQYIAAHHQVLGRSFKLFAIHVDNHLMGKDIPMTLHEGEPQNKALDEAMAHVRPILQEAHIAFEEVALAGNAADELQLYAEQAKLDILVMGSHGYGRIRSAVMGSVTEQLANRSTIPLLIARAED